MHVREGLDVNGLVAALISVVVGGGLATLATVGLVTTQTQSPAETPTDVITYDG